MIITNSEQKKEKCLICQSSKLKYIYNLGQPICSDCWKDNVQLKNKLSPEINQITEKVFLGNAEAQIDKENLKKIGITHILIVANELQILHPFDFVYKHIMVHDFPFEEISKYFEEAIEFIEKSDKIFVHCLQGKSRSASIVIAYFMRKNEMSFEESLKFLKSKRNIQPNKGFIKQLQNFK